MLTRAQIDQFHRDGFLKIPGVFQGEELEKLLAAADRVVEEGINEKGENHLYHIQPDGKKEYFRSERMWLRDEIFQAVTVNLRLLKCIGQCIGHPFAPLNDSFVCKLPGGKVPVLFHQDAHFNKGEMDSPDIPDFVVDIYLNPSTTRNGCVWGLPGRHLVGTVNLRALPEEEIFEQAQPCEMESGDVLFHALSAPHGSKINLTPEIRRIFYVHYATRPVYDQLYAPSGKAPEKAKKSGKKDEQAEFHTQKVYGKWPEGRRFEEAYELAHSMLKIRQTMGFSGIENSAVKLTDHGFEFVGSPGTPQFYWRKLKSEISPDRKAALKGMEAISK